MLKNTRRRATILGLTAVAGLTLSACSETGSTGESQVEGLSETTGELQGEGATSQQRAMDLIEQLVTQVPVYHLRCTISEEAVTCLEAELRKAE